MACGASVIDELSSSLGGGCAALDVSGCWRICFLSLDVVVGAGPDCSCSVVACSVIAAGASGLCSVPTADDTSLAFFNGPLFLGGLGGALRLSR